MKTYYKPVAENSRTKERVQQQDLTGFEFTDENQAWEAARGLAEKMTRKNNIEWVAKVDRYSK